MERASLVVTVDITTNRIIEADVYSSGARGLTSIGKNFRFLDVYSVDAPRYHEARLELLALLKRDPYFAWILPIMRPERQLGA
jgi:hypothetical protein